jgi:hypothetical protein
MAFELEYTLEDIEGDRDTHRQLRSPARLMESMLEQDADARNVR